MPSAHRILLVSQTFPPYKGIGGRRWAKFAKYLQANGNQVQVVCADLMVEKKSPWKDDVTDIPIHTYKHNFPRVVEQFPKNILEKIDYRIKLAKLKRMSHGTPYDRALLDFDSFKEVLLKRLREFKPDYLIVTGAPFYLLYYALGLKEQFPQTKFVADFRDPWTWGASYGYSELSDKRLKYEKLLEKSVVSSYDLILSPWPSIVEKLKSLYPENRSKIELMEHGYDPEDFDELSNESSVSKYDLIFGGTIYRNTEKILEEIIQKFSSEIDIGLFSNDLKKLNIEGSDSHMSGLIDSKEFFKRVGSSKAVLMLIPEHMKDGIPSKLFEYAFLGTPIIAVGNRGELSLFIESNAFGIFLDDIASLSKSLKELSVKENREEVLLNYNFDHLTRKLLGFLEKK